jgi:riboflavin kinase / FMN adenylyltransferase
MDHYRSLNDLRFDGAFVTIGAFDGVHLGHQALVRGMVEAAHQAGLPAVVVTFYPHPAVVLRGIQKPYYLTSPEERARLFGALGVDAVVTLEFSAELARVSATDFVARLHERLGLKALWVGADFALGKGREGDVAFLRRLGQTLGYVVQVVEPVALPGLVISSSQARALLEEGAVDQAARILGRLYGYCGLVVHGDGRGRTIGIPTANIQPWEGQLLPRNGVYACWVEVDGLPRPAVTNVGMRPTFENTPPIPRVEALLLDFDQDLYGKTLCVQFMRFLRPEQRFAGVEALLAQIGIDREQAKEILSHER